MFISFSSVHSMTSVHNTGNMCWLPSFDPRQSRAMLPNLEKKLKFSFHLIWTFFVNIGCELRSWLTQISFLSPPPRCSALPPRSQAEQAAGAGEGPNILLRHYFNNPELASLRCGPVLLTAAHCKLTLSLPSSVKLGLELQSLAGGLGQSAQKSLSLTHCSLCNILNTYVMCSKFLKIFDEVDWKNKEKGNILMETWYWRSRLYWKLRSTHQFFIVSGDNLTWFRM